MNTAESGQKGRCARQQTTSRRSLRSIHGRASLSATPRPRCPTSSCELGILAIAHQVEFGFLRTTLQLTAGNLGQHLTVLERPSWSTSTTVALLRHESTALIDDVQQLTAHLVGNLSAGRDSAIAGELITEVMRGVLDEHRQDARLPAPESFAARGPTPTRAPRTSPLAGHQSAPAVTRPGSGEQHGLAQDLVDGGWGLHRDHVPGVGDDDLACAGDARGEHVGHLPEAGNV